ncbi:MAG: hypothetical protein K1X53_07600 [Candidatus Sumerlaeaceae bacterium]|nr:hypothetical protein [Candidatus Sumerlaeaceae bacterium]
MGRRTFGYGVRGVLATLTAIHMAFGVAVAPAQPSQAVLRQLDTKVAGPNAVPGARKLSDKLIDLDRKIQSRTATAKSFAAAQKLMASKDGRLLIEVVATKVDDALLSKLQVKGIEVRDSYPDQGTVYLLVSDVSPLYDILSIEEIGLIRPVEQPARLRAGSVDSRGDRAVNATSLYPKGITGAGQKVGIISDTFAWTSSVRSDETQPALGLPGTLVNANNQKSGDLPPTVQLVRDDGGFYQPPATDEGAAMGEIVYDVAPDADLAFHTAWGGQSVFADGIKKLRSAGCTVIVDDIIYFAEPVYQDGIIAREAANAVKAGIPYFSAAGNFGNSAVEQTYKEFKYPANVTLPDTVKNSFHDFGSGSPFLPISLKAGDSITVVLQWNQPFWSVNPVNPPTAKNGAQVDLDLFLTSTPDPAGLSNPILLSKQGQGFPGLPYGDPIETFSFVAGYTGLYYISIPHWVGPIANIPQIKGAPLTFRLLLLGAPVGSIAGIPDDTSAYGASTIWGHSLASGAAAIGAVPWWEHPLFNPNGFPPTNLIDPEKFSAKGGSLTVFFDSTGRGTKRSIYAPLVAAPDGVNTTFFGISDAAAGSADFSKPTGPRLPLGYANEPDGLPNFFGTSASAPHAAAVGALMKSMKSTLKPAQINTTLQNTAIDAKGRRAAVGQDPVTGFGVINAGAAVTQVAQGVNVAFARASDWPYSLLVVNDCATTDDKGILDPSLDVFVKFTLINNGSTGIVKPFNTQILVDGVIVTTIVTPSLASGATSPQCYNIGPLAAGPHTIQVITDSSNVARETNEKDNSRVRSVNVTEFPDNDNFDEAGYIINCTTLIQGDNFGATKEPGEPTPTGNPGGSSVWYRWTPNFTGEAGIETSGSQMNVIIGVYTGPNVGSLTEVAAGVGSLKFPVVSGTEYFILIDGVNGATGVFFLRLASPSNDFFDTPGDFGNACFGTTITQTTICTTKETGEPNHAGNAGGHSVWYKWTSPTNGKVTFDTIGSNFDTLLAAYTGVAVNALTPVASNDDIVPGVNVQSLTTFTVTLGQVFYIAVDGKNGAVGNVVLNFKAEPLNNNFVDRLTVAGCLGTTVGYNTCADKEIGEPNHAGVPGGVSVWYRWVGATTGFTTWTVSGVGFSPVIAVYTGASVGALTPVTSTNPGYPGVPVQIAFNCIKGVEYQIAIDSVTGLPGTSFQVQWQTQTGNDDFFRAKDLQPVCNGTTVSDNVCASKQPGEPNHAGNPGGSSVWFRWVAPVTDFVTFSTAGSSFDTLLGVYHGSQVNLLIQDAANDDAGPGGTSQVTFKATSGFVYYVAVDGKNNATGDINISWNSEPGNDDLNNRQLLTGCSGGPINASNACASKEPMEPNHAGNAGGGSLWYEWESTTSGTAVFSTLGSNFDTLLAVYSGTDYFTLTPTVSNDNDAALLTSRVSFPVQPGQRYVIAVDGKNNARGNIVLTFTSGPDNNNFANAFNVVPPCVGTMTATNLCGTKEPGEPVHAGNAGGASVWFRWTSPVTDTVTFDTNGSGIDTLLGVYTGLSVGALTQVAANDDFLPLVTSRVQFAAQAGFIYYIAVDGKNGATGNIQLSWNASAVNDDFVNRTAIANCFGQATGSNGCATKEPGEPNHGGNAGGGSLWFAWTAPQNGIVTFDTFTSNFDTLLAAYTGNSVGALTLITQNDDAGPGGTSQISFIATAGTVYNIAIDGKNNVRGAFVLNWVSPPSNDNLVNASLIPGCSITTSTSNSCATKEVNEPNHAGNAGGASVWYTWTAPGSDSVTIDTIGSGIDTLLAVYTSVGPSINTLVPIISNDDIVAPLTSRVVFNAVQGTQYFIAVDGKNGARGSIVLNLSSVRPNDFFATRQLLDGCNLQTTASTTCATKEPGEPNHAGNAGGASLWYTWTSVTSSTVIINTNGSNFDTILGVYTGNAVNALTPVASDNNSGADNIDSRVSFLSGPNTVYQIAVDGFNGATGNMVLNIISAPDNNDLTSASLVVGCSGTTFTSNGCATKENNEPNHGGNAGGASIWFAWTSPVSDSVTFDTAGSAIDTLLAVYTSVGPAIGTLNLVAQNDDALPGGLSRVTYTAIAGTTYYIAVDGKNGATGNVALNWSGVRPNDFFVNSQLVTGCSIVTTASSTCATKDTGEPNHAGNAGGASLWYTWTSETTGVVTITTDGSDFDTLLGVYTGNAVNSLTSIAQDDDSGGLGSGPTSKVVFNTVPGVTYRIAVDGKNGVTGNMTLSIRLQPANNDLANAPTITGCFGTVTTISTCATKEPGEPNHGGNAGGSSIWFKWTSPTSDIVTFDTLGSSFDTLLAVYTSVGPSIATLQLVKENDDDLPNTTSKVTFTAAQATTYYIAIDGKNGASGSARLNWSAVRSNDLFINRLPLSGCVAITTASTTCATAETSEPDHVTSAAASLWYTWTAPTSGTVYIDTAGSNFDTVLSVYTGPGLTSLTLVQENDNDNSPGATTSSVAIAAATGTVYQIAVDGAGGATGDMVLNIAQSPDNDDREDATSVSAFWLNPSGENEGTTCGTNVCATLQTPEAGGHPTGNPGGASVWWTWVAPNTGPTTGVVTFDTVGSNFDTLIAVYDSILQGANDNIPQTNTVTSRISIVWIAGREYNISVDGKNGAQGGITLNWHLGFGPNYNILPAPNDMFSAALGTSFTLIGASGETTGSNIASTVEIGEPIHAGVTTPVTSSTVTCDGSTVIGTNHTVWFNWTCPLPDGIQGVVTFETERDAQFPFDTVLAIYTGDAVNALIPISSNNDNPQGDPLPLDSRITFVVTGAQNYKVVVSGFDTGKFLLRWYITPSGFKAGSGTAKTADAELN